jgi:hypothetical protein
MGEMFPIQTVVSSFVSSFFVANSSCMHCFDAADAPEGPTKVEVEMINEVELRGRMRKSDFIRLASR